MAISDTPATSSSEVARAAAAAWLSTYERARALGCDPDEAEACADSAYDDALSEFAHRKGAILDDQPRQIWNKRTELEQRLVADVCELCGSDDAIEVHHVRALKDRRGHVPGACSKR